MSFFTTSFPAHRFAVSPCEAVFQSASQLRNPKNPVGHCLLRRVLLLLRKLALEMAFDIFTTKRVSCVGQDDRIDDLITCQLSGDKCAVFRQFLVMNFTSLPSSSILIHSSSGILYLFSGDQGVSRVYVVRCQKSRMGNEKPRSRDLAFERCMRGTATEKGPYRKSLPERTIPESLDRDRGEKVLDSHCAVCMYPTKNRSYRI